MALIDNLVSYYSLEDDEANTDIDDETTTNNGVLNGGETTAGVSVAGIVSNGFEFDGNDWMTMPQILDDWNPFTMQIWFKTSYSADKQLFFENGWWMANTDTLMILLDEDGTITVYPRESDGSSLQLIIPANDYQNGEWHQLVVTYDGTTVQTYMDGSANVGGLFIWNGMRTYDWIFGRQQTAAQQRYFRGVFDEIGVWSRSLTGPEVTALWNDGNGLSYPFEVLPPPPTEGFLEILGITAPTEAHEGDLINFIVHTKNTGASDNFKIELSGIGGEIFEGFETGFVEWKNVTGDDFDWTRKSGSTSSSSTGPTGAYEGNYYAYTESSSPNYPNKIAYLESPEINSILGLSFNYHMYGSTMGTLSLEISEYPYSTWAQIWSLSGNQGNAWYLANIDLSAYSGQTIKLRFKGYTGSSFTSDIAVDNISILTTLSSEFSLGAGLTKNVPFSFIMPLNDVSIIINTYHLTEEGDWVWDVSSVWDVNRWF